LLTKTAVRDDRAGIVVTHDSRVLILPTVSPTWTTAGL
jgi:hypothetical protein